MNLNSPLPDFPSEIGVDQAMLGPILALETSGKSASVAIAWPDGRIADADTDPSIGSARTLAPAIHAILQSCALAASDLKAIAVTVGPGSFTGLRVGVATAKSMAYALRIPTIAIDSLETIAVETTRRLASENSFSVGEPSMIWTVMDAFRGELFAALWSELPSEPTSAIEQGDANSDKANVEVAWSKEILSSHLVNASTWTESILQSAPTRQSSIILAGPGLFRCPRLLSTVAESRIRVLNNVVPRAAVVAQLGLRKLMQQQTTDAFRLMPVYLRGSAAEEKLLHP
jgi:tRNA threonylcarbamoyladenosine biosynthesis protein TsaB